MDYKDFQSKTLPVPVSAPGKGATPVGKLCVSAVSRGCKVSGTGVAAEGPARIRHTDDRLQSLPSTWVQRTQGVHVITSNRGAVVVEGDDAIVVVVVQAVML